jgi:site-specific recombinase XerD
MPTFTEAKQQFLLACQADGLSAATTKWYHERLKGLDTRLGDLPIDNVTVGAIRNYIVDLRARTNRWENATQRPAVAGGLSNDTVQGHIRAMRRFFKWCTAEYGLSEKANPMLGIRAPKRNRPAPKSIEPIDLRTLLDGCPATTQGKRDKAMLAFLADTGCRAAGVINLRMADIRFEQGQAVVREKGERDRIVPFTPYTAGLINEWLAVRPDQAATLFCALSPRLIGKPLTISGLQSMIKRLKKKTGVTGRANPHSFRHGFARHWLTVGGNLATLAVLMGHSDPSTTLRYYAIFMMSEAIADHKKFSPMKEYK